MNNNLNKPLIFSSDIHLDSRGYFSEIYNKKNKNFKKIQFIQDNLSYSSRGVLRGLHYQLLYPQTKLITVIYGKIFDVAVNLKKTSKNFGKVYSFNMTSKRNNQLLIPPYFAHGFQCLSEYALVHYKCDNYYYYEDQYGIIYDDNSFNINWPLKNKIISKKDKKLPFFDKKNKYF